MSWRTWVVRACGAMLILAGVVALARADALSPLDVVMCGAALGLGSAMVGLRLRTRPRDKR